MDYAAPTPRKAGRRVAAFGLLLSLVPPFVYLGLLSALWGLQIDVSENLVIGCILTALTCSVTGLALSIVSLRLRQRGWKTLTSLVLSALSLVVGCVLAPFAT